MQQYTNTWRKKKFTCENMVFALVPIWHHCHRYKCVPNGR